MTDISEPLLERMGELVLNHCLDPECAICDIVAQAMFEIERLAPSPKGASASEAA